MVKIWPNKFLHALLVVVETGTTCIGYNVSGSIKITCTYPLTWQVHFSESIPQMSLHICEMANVKGYTLPYPCNSKRLEWPKCLSWFIQQWDRND